MSSRTILKKDHHFKKSVTSKVVVTVYTIKKIKYDGKNDEKRGGKDSLLLM